MLSTLEAMLMKQLYLRLDCVRGDTIEIPDEFCKIVISTTYKTGTKPAEPYYVIQKSAAGTNKSGKDRYDGKSLLQLLSSIIAWRNWWHSETYVPRLSAV